MPGVIAIPSSWLPKVLKELEGRGADVVILDTAPHSEGTALDAARAADLILVPCQPSIMDLRAMRKTTDLLKHIKKPTYAVLNGVSVQGSAALGTEKAIAAEFKIEICPIRMGDRVAYSRCLISGHSAQEYEPEGKAAREAHKFHKWVSGHMADKLVGGLFAKARTAARQRYVASAGTVGRLMRLFHGTIDALAAAQEGKSDAFETVDNAVGWPKLLRVRKRS